MAKKTVYSVTTGLWKSIKNVAVVIGIPALVFLIDNWTQWVPEEYSEIVFASIGFLSYFVKNYIDNK